MYNTNHRQDGFCLLYYVSDHTVRDTAEYILAHQIIPYCLRPLEENILAVDFNFNKTIHSSFTFAELREKNISSELLLTWPVSIDLAESYQIFLDNVTHSSSLENKTLFYNCTSSWFGPICRFTFDSRIDKTLDEVIASNFELKPDNGTDNKVTCYKHLNCQTSFTCLDWREICNGHIDCLDGSDEFNCWQLEINECAENEYRCHNGQCIPEKFFHDGSLNLDCLDQTDEHHHLWLGDICQEDPAFRCEEQTCRPGVKEFSCGDGICVALGDRPFCYNGRDNLLLGDLCSTTISCIMNILNQIDWEKCKQICGETDCINDHCPSFFEFPPGPILFGHVRFMYENKKIPVQDETIRPPDYLCYDEKLCAGYLPATVNLNNFTCRHFHELPLDETKLFYERLKLIEYVKNRFRPCSTVSNETHYCNHSSMYQCENSIKCISKHRLVDGFQDCPLNDDETFNQSCSLSNAHRPFTCTVGDKKKCFAFYIVRYDWGCQEKQITYQDIDRLGHQKYQIDFLKICDKILDVPSMFIDERYETDETECEHWPCNNTYTRCDGFWLCKDGADEINCAPSICSEFEHECVFLNDTSKMSCLPIARAGNNHTDCFGASDEPDFCQRTSSYSFGQLLRCENDVKCFFSTTFCTNGDHCPLGDDERFCTEDISIIDEHYVLGSNPRAEVRNFLFRTFKYQSRPTIYFKLSHMPTYPLQLMTDIASFPLLSKTKTKLIQTNKIINTTYGKGRWWRCNRGLLIQIRMSDDTKKSSCLCPPSYYGDQCQYQNQRVSLTLQIQSVSDWRNVFTFIITLIDNEKNIESHDYIEYLPIRDCDTKFNVYLLYSNRPKNSSKNYSVQLHAFNKLTLHYRASWIFPLQFPFLPVHRLSVLLQLPISDVEFLQKCTSPCIHGLCFNHINDQNSTFCQCLRGWLGTHCNIEHQCNCASNSLCIGDSICVCRIGRVGPRCHLPQSSCHLKLCVNGGECVSNDERYLSADSRKSTCICSEQYFGEHCEHQRTRIDVSFHKRVTIPSSLLVHFITVQNNAEPIRRSVMKNIAFDQNLVIFYTSFVFNIAFAQTASEYYLLILRELNISSANISTQINPSYRCLSVHDLFDETLANRDLLRRIKHYHIPCKNKLELVCFYDEIHLCLCNRLRHVNCFKFDHDITYNCSKYNLCKNEGQCFLDDPKCPTSSICVCRDCSYGSKCQFSTRGSTLSLDTILGSNIRPYTGLSRQSTVVKVAIAIVTTIFTLGLVNSLCCLLTFQMKKTRDFGCGLYLFTSSITSTITMSVLTIKFWFLLAAQMGSIENRSFVDVQCKFIDFLLRLLLSTSDWLSACVAMERAVNVSKGIKFNRAKSKKVAKWMILFVFLFTSFTHIHDPIHRHLIDDEEEQRTWCVTKYSSSLQALDWIVNILHFSVPFAINCISALMIISIAARSRSKAQTKESYKTLLREQFYRHKHLLISPLILVILALPRLIISFLFRCMESARNPWLYLIGYFFSFIPPTLIFVVFVLPSELYKKEFYNSIRRFW